MARVGAFLPSRQHRLPQALIFTPKPGNKRTHLPAIAWSADSSRWVHQQRSFAESNATRRGKRCGLGYTYADIASIAPGWTSGLGRTRTVA